MFSLSMQMLDLKFSIFFSQSGFFMTFPHVVLCTVLKDNRDRLSFWSYALKILLPGACIVTRLTTVINICLKFYAELKIPRIPR